VALFVLLSGGLLLAGRALTKKKEWLREAQFLAHKIKAGVASDIDCIRFIVARCEAKVDIKKFGFTTEELRLIDESFEREGRVWQTC